MLDRFVALDPLPEEPAVLAASHTGNWELAAAAFARLRPLVVVAKPFSSSIFDAFVGRLRARLGIRTIAPRGALKAARDALASGAFVVMPIDQVPERRGHAIRAPFLGEVAFVDRAPFVLARRAKVSVVACAAHRDGHVHRVRALGVARRPEDATAALDAFVRAHPEAWMWLHRRWRAPFDRLETTPWTTPSSSQASASRAA